MVEKSLGDANTVRIYSRKYCDTYNRIRCVTHSLPLSRLLLLAKTGTIMQIAWYAENHRSPDPRGVFSCPSQWSRREKGSRSSTDKPPVLLPRSGHFDGFLSIFIADMDCRTETIDAFQVLSRRVASNESK